MYRPQKKFLRLLNTSDSNAILEYGTIEARSKFFWLLKDWIDRQFMNRYQVTPLPPMASPDCGGCGSKLASDSLRQALKTLSISAGDDVAIRSLSSGTIALSVDHFKNFGLNPFNLGQVAAIHALSDFTAKGLKGKFALANFILEKSNESIAACELELLLRGARNILDQEGIEIVGGQTGLGIETSAGFSIIGEGDSLWKKSGAKSGDAIILTKPLGAGILLAAREQGALSGSCFEELLESMLRSSSSLISTLRKYSVTAATDVTGFGLAGHLSEMLSKDSLYAKLNYSDLPVFSSARELARKGYESRMANQNRRSFSANFSPDPLIYDPQTSGGLLFTLPSLEAERCLAEIMPSWPSARIIGYVVSSLQ
jgi:selenide,water dikinase